ncbi:MAG TPA: beta-glucosidase BglX [Bacteroidales bacterium]|nr:beta-glucosidase BglX [Bacteroidales bacterium]
MNRFLYATVVLCFILLSGCKKENRMDSYISNLMNKMSTEEKIGQLNLEISGGYTTGSSVNQDVQQKIKEGKIGSVLNSFSVASMKAMQEIAVKESKNHIPILFGMDVIHGYRTIFPIPLAMSCSWEPGMLEKAARIAAKEATTSGIAWTYSPMVDIARDPRWGRIAEGAGEDPWLGSRMAEAVVKGYQGEDLAANNTMMACVKHFALYGAAEAGRDYNTVELSRVTMYNYYLSPYKAAVDAGAGSIMSSFNVIDAVPSTGNRWLLTDLLRNQWGFKGFVVSDYTAVNEMINHGMGNLQEVSALALKAGLDMDMVGEGFLTTLKKSLDEGKVTLDQINTACRRVLEAKYKLGLFDDPFRYFSEERAAKEISTADDIKTAREMCLKSMVLLKNDKQVLPLKKSGTVAVVGPLADNKGEMLGTWTLLNNLSSVSTVLDGIRNTGGSGVKTLYAQGSELTDVEGMKTPYYAPSGMKKPEVKSPEVLINEAVNVARKADVVVAVLGESAAWSGEASCRADIGLPSLQENLLKALVATGKPVVLVLMNGRPLTLPWENDNVTAILEGWNLGMEGGNAVADVLFGNYNPSGKLTTTFPRSVGQIPLYYNHLNTGRPADPRNHYTSKYLDISNDPVYPFGYGLSYTTFAYGDPVLSKNELRGEETLTVKVPLTNTGKVAGEEVVQLYIADPVASISRPVKELKNFSKVMLQPGESKDIKFDITTKDLSFYNSELQYVWEPGEFIIYAGTNSRDVKAAKVTWNK